MGAAATFGRGQRSLITGQAMFEAPDSQYLVPFDGAFKVSESTTAADSTGDNWKEGLKKSTKRLDQLQRLLHADNRHSVLLLFQAMDAAGKDSTIRAVMRGINPAGVQVFNFRKPSTLELDHDFLWRTGKRLPERGRIGIFNRSQYEEVLVARVHPSILDGQRLPRSIDLNSIWDERLESIRHQELHQARNGMVILKFWLNVSKEEQKARFLSRLDEPEKNWKFEYGDIVERRYWDDYMHAYEEALNATSRPWAPWYAIPADNKPYMRACVAEIVVEALSQLGLAYPDPSSELKDKIGQIKKELDQTDAGTLS
jgi:PPK2 family polyphosphate:nucleotide phosphotransferase